MVDFNKLRFDRTHHLGLGDVRLTIGQQQEIDAEIAALRLLYDGATVRSEVQAEKIAALRAENERLLAILSGGDRKISPGGGMEQRPDWRPYLGDAAQAENRDYQLVLDKYDAACARVVALEAALRERDGGDHDRECRIWMSNWQKREDRYCNCGHVEARALLEQKP